MEEYTEPYIFDNPDVYYRSLIHLINIYLKDNIVGLELGIGVGQNLCTLLQKCPSIKTMYAVDAYQPYANYIKQPYDGTPFSIGDRKQVESGKLIAMHNIKYSGHKDKVIFFEEKSLDVAKKIEDNSLDFIFMDSYSTLKDVTNDLNAWYPKVKSGGLISGHDWQVTQVQEIINNFRKTKNIKNKISGFDNIWVWVKE